MGRIIEEHKDLLGADLLLFCDGPMHQSRRTQLVFGVRGDVTVDVTTYGATRPLHSGHYGNWAPNPIMQLAHLLASMRDPTGHILIDGYYDDVVPLGELDRDAIARMPEYHRGPERRAVRAHARRRWRAVGGTDCPAGAERLRPTGGWRRRQGPQRHRRLRHSLDSTSASSRTRRRPRSASAWKRISPGRATTSFTKRRRTRHCEATESGTARLGIGYPALRTPLDHPMAERLTALPRAADLLRMSEALADAVIERHKRRKKRARLITIDLDPTEDATHGGQQLTFFNSYYDSWCYLPMAGFLTFDEEVEQYLCCYVLRGGDAPGQARLYIRAQTPAAAAAPGVSEGPYPGAPRRRFCRTRGV